MVSVCEYLFVLEIRSFILVCMYSIFLIHVSVDGHLGCFPVLVIVNSAAINIEVHVYFSNQYFHFFPNIYPGEELMEQIVVIYLVF